MSRAMRIIEACRPKILACQHIKLRPSRAFWKLRSGKGDVALENQREALLHFIGRCADGDSAGHISGAIAILAAGIHQIERAHLNGAIGLFLRAVMDNCAIGRSEEHTSELQSLMRISYAVFCLKKKNNLTHITQYLSRKT